MMENEKAERLKTLLADALQPVIEKLDQLEKEIQDLKKQK
jgi:uncharacterized protein (UPF0335 family)